MKAKHELQDIISQISSDASPVGMDAVYVHALILDKLSDLDRRLSKLEAAHSEDASLRGTDQKTASDCR